MDEVIKLILPFYKVSEIEKIETELKKYNKTLPAFEPLTSSLDWYKNSTIYMTYPESIKISNDSPLKNLTEYLPQIKSLGCNAIHILPFLESPMRDKGFDVSNYYKIREGLGGMHELIALKKEADRQGMRIFMDLIFNHVSKEHEWFIKAQNGEEYYREFFIYTKETPQFIGKIERNSTVYAQYLVNGEKTMVSVVFPEFAGELPHWVQGKDRYWYYHTFYPHQIDLNWKNPHVFIEMAKILLFWANQGFNFRLDAIPFVGKTAYKHLNTHNAFTHHLTTAFNLLAQQQNHECAFIFEVNEHFNADTEYFGTVNFPQANLLYDFQLTTYLWVSLVERNVRYLWRKIQKDKQIPIHGQWINFLRNHDDLSFAYLSNDLMQEMQKKLTPLGKSFREGFSITGRTYSLLGSNEKRLLMAYCLLAALPGSMLLPYGDEYAMSNIPESQLSPFEKIDARNINRGILSEEIIQSNKGKHLFPRMKEIFEKRQTLRNYLNIRPEEIMGINEKEIFAAKYKQGTSELIVLINLSPHPKIIHLTTGQLQQIVKVNEVTMTEHKIELGEYGGCWLQK